MSQHYVRIRSRGHLVTLISVGLYIHTATGSRSILAGYRHCARGFRLLSTAGSPQERQALSAGVSPLAFRKRQLRRAYDERKALMASVDYRCCARGQKEREEGRISCANVRGTRLLASVRPKQHPPSSNTLDQPKAKPNIPASSVVSLGICRSPETLRFESTKRH